MRVAFVIPCLRVSTGWRSASLGIVQALQEFSQVDPFVVVSEADRKAAGELLPDCEGVSIPEVQFMALGRPKSWPRMARSWSHLKRVSLPRIDLVHSLEGYPSGLVGHWLSKRAGLGHVLTAIGTYSVRWGDQLPDRWAYEAVLRGADVICPISRGTATLMRRSFPRALADKMLQVVLLGCGATKRVPRETAEAPRSDRPVLLSVGAVKPRKGYHVSVEAFAKIRLRIPAAEYWIAGAVNDGEYLESLRARIAALDLGGVKFLGEVSDEELDRLYRAAGVFFLAPQEIGRRFEGFGLVFLEAGAYGLPVVATRVGGVPDAVQEEITGFLCAPDDSDALANAALKLLQDKKLARRMGIANRERAEFLSWERFATEQGSVYEEVLDGVVSVHPASEVL